MLDELLVLLQEIRSSFTQCDAKHKSPQHASLIDRLDSFLHVNLQRKQTLPKNCLPYPDVIHTQLTYSSESVSADKSVQSNFSTLSCEEEPFDKKPLHLSIIEESQKWCANMINDFFVLEYNHHDQKYKILSYSNGDSHDRKSLADLVLSHEPDHVKEIKKSPSMTEILKLTTNKPKILKPLIMPLLLGERVRYVYIFETQETIKFGEKYFSTTRFYFLISHWSLTSRINSLLHAIAKTAFEVKFQRAGALQLMEFEEADQLLNQKSMLKISNLIHDFENDLSHQLDSQGKILEAQICEMDLCLQVLMNYEMRVRLSELYLSSVNIQVLMFALVMFDFKIVLMASSEHRNFISWSILSLLRCIKPLSYVSPIVISIASTRHMNFVDSPVPIIVGMWGKESTCNRYKERINLSIQKEMLQKDQRSLKTVLLDLNKSVVIHQPFDEEESMLIKSLIKRVGSNSSGQPFIHQRLAAFMRDELLGEGSPNEQVKLWKTKLHQTQMHNCWLETKTSKT